MLGASRLCLTTSETVTWFTDVKRAEDVGVEGVVVGDDVESGIGNVEGGRGAENVEGDVGG